MPSGRARVGEFPRHGFGPSGGDRDQFVSLAPTADNGTELRWGADITLFGTIATMGARLIPSLSKSLTADFFTRVRQTLEA
jgi:carbon monoxide dehydrogenase subunit G